MTTLLLEAPAVVRARGSRRTSPVALSGAARACRGLGRPRLLLVPGGAVDAAPTRLYWTRRGLVLVLAAVAMVVGLMAATLVTTFLGVSNEPLGPPAQASPILAAAFRAG